MLCKHTVTQWEVTNDVFSFAVSSFNCPVEVSFDIKWYLKFYPCHNEFSNIEVSGVRACYEGAYVWIRYFMLKFPLLPGNVREDTTE